MHGSNTLKLNEATMREIVQHYFDTVMFADGQSPSVTSVAYDSNMNDRSFNIKVSEHADKPAKTSDARLAA